MPVGPVLLCALLLTIPGGAVPLSYRVGLGDDPEVPPNPAGVYGCVPGGLVWGVPGLCLPARSVSGHLSNYFLPFAGHDPAPWGPRCSGGTPGRRSRRSPSPVPRYRPPPGTRLPSPGPGRAESCAATTREPVRRKLSLPVRCWSRCSGGTPASPAPSAALVGFADQADVSRLGAGRGDLGGGTRSAHRRHTAHPLPRPSRDPGRGRRTPHPVLSASHRLKQTGAGRPDQDGPLRFSVSYCT